MSTELPPGLYDNVKAVALRLALADLTQDDELARQAAIRTELIGLYTASPGLLIGVVGYLLAHFTDGLIRGYGSRPAAVDEITKELAAAVLAAGDAQS
ncbi:hypothetical protein KXD96_15435 [Mycobacterium sp. SMC-2]|uniref:hypothetical protein n=1 Tax=Mycobacterium sp. SMC-2 TaxID=2857058 RepID=UPI0021B2D6D9|nr:hypothetical protein [Mycobacterium sp. SMC-2]UXA04422.1 hypothetical protein KXD96_15435 [Mycobacterium sp. SMC-2]